MAEKILLLTGSGFSIRFLKNENNKELSTPFLTKLLTDREQFEKYLELLLKDLYNKEEERLRFIQIQKKCKEVFELLKLEKNSIEFNFEHIFFALECICDLSTKHTNILPQNIEGSIKKAVLSSSIKFEYKELNALYSFLIDVVCLFEREDRKVKKFQSTNLECITKFKKVLDTQETKHFTLNYDTCFYDSKLTFLYSNKTHELVEGNYQNIKNYHLHGSVLNYREGDIERCATPDDAKDQRLIKFDFKTQRNDFKSYFSYEYSNLDNGYLFPIITGLSKSIKLLNSSYDWLYQQFILSAYEATHLIIIGYSFNDTHINSVLSCAIENEKLKKIDVVYYKSVGVDFETIAKSKIKRSDKIQHEEEVINKFTFHRDGVEEFISNFKLD